MSNYDPPQQPWGGPPQDPYGGAPQYPPPQNPGGFPPPTSAFPPGGGGFPPPPGGGYPPPAQGGGGYDGGEGYDDGYGGGYGGGWGGQDHGTPPEILITVLAAALGIGSTRRPYHLGDVHLGARFLLIPGPPGWPHPDTIVRRSLRTTLGVRMRLPTGSGDTRIGTELPPSGGHLGLGVDVLNDVFLTHRWYVNVSASGDWLLPADVLRQPFTLAQPFPVDSAVTSVRRVPGPRVAFSVTPRWRLTNEIAFHGEYAMLAQARTRYEAPDSILPSVFDWRTGGAMHALGIGIRYSSLQAFARGRARVPFELTLSASEAVLGTVQAPDAFSVRLTGRVFVDPRRIRALLPGRDSVIPPPDAPLDTLPSQLRPDSVPALNQTEQEPPPAVVTEPPATPPATPPAPPAPPPATTPTQRPPSARGEAPPAGAIDATRGAFAGLIPSPLKEWVSHNSFAGFGMIPNPGKQC